MQLLRGDRDEDRAGPLDSMGVERKKQGSDERAKAEIICAQCAHRLTTLGARAQVEGAHRHVKVNPHGHVYHITCFHPVPGVIPIGKPSPEFPWFSGYRWQIALCGGCQIHLGWWFSGNGSFAALIEGRFVEGDGSGSD